MSRQSEKLHKEIAQVMSDLDCTFIEAILEVCQTHQIDPEDIVKQMDDITMARARQCAIDNRMIQKSVTQKEGQSQLKLE